MCGLKDASRAFGMSLSRSLQEIGYQHGVTDRQIWRQLEKNSKPGTGAHCGLSHSDSYWRHQRWRHIC
eukprot:12903850-Prorocentrum_lima.AAC.1